jgi:hypothetical protein
VAPRKEMFAALHYCSWIGDAAAWLRGRKASRCTLLRSRMHPDFDRVVVHDVSGPFRKGYSSAHLAIRAVSLVENTMDLLAVASGWEVTCTNLGRLHHPLDSAYH